MLSRSLWFGCFALLASCSDARVDRSSTQPVELVVIEGATDVHRVGRDSRAYELTYRLNSEYPAESVVAQIRAALSPDRWRPLAQDWLNPGNPSGFTRGWSDFVDKTKTPNTIVHVWSAEWRDDDGNLVTYGLRYDSSVPPGATTRATPDNRKLRVSAAFLPTAVVSATRKQLGIAEALQ